MKQYHEALEHILEHGVETEDRTGIGTISYFGMQMRYNLQDGFPAVTTKKLAWKSVVAELLWFLEGSTDERRLAELTYQKYRRDILDKKTIWTANADNQGVALGYLNNDMTKILGPVYGSQWRHFDRRDGVDQIKRIIKQIRNESDSRRIILSAWNPNQIDLMALPPCHVLSQFRVMNGKLSCQLYQRSVDMGLGAVFNVASYALLTHIIARECNLDVGDFIHTVGDAHIYKNHIPAIEEQLKRKSTDLPELFIDSSFNLLNGLDFRFSIDTVNLFRLEGYNPHPTIKMEMAI